MKTLYPSCRRVFPYRPIPVSEFGNPSVDQGGYPVPKIFEDWGRSSTTSSTPGGRRPPDVQKVLGPLHADGAVVRRHLGGRVRFLSMLRSSARAAAPPG